MEAHFENLLLENIFSVFKNLLILFGVGDKNAVDSVDGLRVLLDAIADYHSLRGVPYI